MFVDAGLPLYHNQKCCITGILAGPLQHGSNFNVFDLFSNNPYRVVKLFAAPETLAASDVIDQRKIMKIALSKLLYTHIPLIVTVDLIHLYDSITTQRYSIDPSIRADISYISFHF